MHSKGKLFVVAVVAGALVMSVYLWARTSHAWIVPVPEGELWKHPLAALLFAFVALIAEGNAVDFRIGIGPRQPQASVAFLPFIAAIFIFTPIVAVSIVAVVVAISQVMIRKADWVRGPFNVAQSVISAGVSAIVFLAITKRVEGSGALAYGFGPVIVAFFATNVALNSVAISLLRGLPLADVIKKVAGPRGSNLLYDVLVSPLAVFSAALYNDAYVGGLLLTVFPLLVVRSSYKAKQEAIEANEDLLFVLVKAIETRDPYTSGHSVRVRDLATSIAADMQLPAAKVQLISKAALLHDIGKIDADYAAVIHKPHDLTSEERVLIQTHAVRGADMLAKLSSVNKEIVLGVRHHHERYDGQGYPDGLHGANIPIAGRIIMICDSVDAMLSDRPYRKALSIDTVRQELERCAGTQFDPAIVQVMLAKDTLERAADTARRENPPSKIFAVS